ncbi:hypothetical protein MNBD_PLANCTO02-2913 [hydrothermal vent metagenome]|uniref:Phage protein n=1 Tax=hydrothermal vent metagenome TaxID=652676 RepID=A0A3B1DJ04_9ZZZZ
MNISASVEKEKLQQEMNLFSKQDVPRKRNKFMRMLAIRVLQNIIKRNPVESGASRAAWVAALEQLGGTAPVGWQGDSPEAASINEGAKQGEVTINDTRQQTKIEATNNVEYIAYLEYGASNRSPFRMVRQALAEVEN